MLLAVGKVIDRIMFSDLTVVVDDTRLVRGVPNNTAVVRLEGRPITHQALMTNYSALEIRLASTVSRMFSRTGDSYTGTFREQRPLGGEYVAMNVKVFSKTGLVVVAAGFAALGCASYALALANYVHGQ